MNKQLIDELKNQGYSNSEIDLILEGVSDAKFKKTYTAMEIFELLHSKRKNISNSYA